MMFITKICIFKWKAAKFELDIKDGYNANR